MSFRLVLDILGTGVIFWSIGRIFHHLSLQSLDRGDDLKKGRPLFFAAMAFYILGFPSSFIIGCVDGMCHKRLYHNHLAEMRALRSYVRQPDLRFQHQDFEEFCNEHEIGRNDSLAPLDIPFSWYAIYF